MKKVYGFLLILLIVCQGSLPGEKVAVLNEVKAPSGFYLHGDHLYIVEFPLVYDYSLKDFHLLKKFGKQGEGPGEWLRFARLHFHPDYFPAVRYVTLVDNRFFAIPYLKKQGKNQLYIFDLKGKLLKQMDMPEVEETLFSFYPFAIKDGKLYRLVENQDEEWELHITEIE